MGYFCVPDSWRTSLCFVINNSAAVIKSKATLALVANSAWNLYNFRRGLIDALQAEGYRVLLVAPDGPERKKLEATGAKFVPLANLRRKGLNPLRDLKLVMELYRIYRQEEVKGALHFTIKPTIYGSFAARRAGIRNVCTLTGLGYTFLSGRKTNRLVRMLYRQALGSADAVFFHNPDDLSLFLEDGLTPKDKSFVVAGSGLQLSEYPYTTYENAIPGRCLFVGRLLTDKGIREFVAAARLAKIRNPNLTFHILGPFDPGNPAGISADELETWTREGVVEYDGVATDIRPHLTRSSVVVLPSYREGCPRVLLEAAAMGRAMIGTDVAGVREVVLDGENGWLVPTKNVEKLADAMLDAGAPGSPLVAMGLAGRKHVEHHFSVESVAEKYLEAVSACLLVEDLSGGE
ncbi:glycosyltransferase family 4 protein [Neolewinella persica]|uniref:glycosyltransferase family 4 protein n=1 Tax=Neolewinella persica TaxID=70998 RepID=UPI00036079DA|nr:glycosyltransferase family 4 protein [Neolewinella persica]